MKFSATEIAIDIFYYVQLTLVVVFFVCLFSGISYLGIDRSLLYYQLTAPLNIYPEDHVVWNLGFFAVILACFEIYLRLTRRNKQVLIGFASAVGACYFITLMFSLINFLLIGSSGIGSGILISLALVIYSDLANRVEYVKKNMTLLNVLTLPIIFVVMMLGVGLAVFFYLGFYTFGNPSAIFHLMAAALSVIAFFNIMKLTGYELARKS